MGIAEWLQNPTEDPRVHPSLDGLEKDYARITPATPVFGGDPGHNLWLVNNVATQSCFLKE
jgi:hypothetical protein